MAQSTSTLWRNTQPFNHVLLENVLANDVSADILAFLEGIVWKEVRGSFFSFHEVPNNIDRDALTDLLLSQRAESLIRDNLENGLQITLSLPVRFGVQKYVQGAGIGPHTDNELSAARFILNLNRGWTPSDGGIWLLSDNNQLLPEPEFIAPANNSGFGFVPGRSTYHALSERNVSEAFAIIFEFPLS